MGRVRSNRTDRLIMMEEKGGFTTFHLEGKLIGDWVGELERSWLRFHGCDPQKHFRIDLSEVVFVDEHGKALLQQLASEGAELGANNPFMRLVIERLMEPAALAHANP